MASRGPKYYDLIVRSREMPESPLCFLGLIPIDMPLFEGDPVEYDGNGSEPVYFGKVKDRRLKGGGNPTEWRLVLETRVKSLSPELLRFQEEHLDRNRNLYSRTETIQQEINHMALNGSSNGCNKKSLVQYGALLQELVTGKVTSREVHDGLQEIVVQLDERAAKKLRSLTDDARAKAYEDGHRDNILTPQELAIMGREFVANGYSKRPHTPIGVQQGMSVEEVNKMREEEGYFEVNNRGNNGPARPGSQTYRLPIIGLNTLILSLERVNGKEETERGPRFLYMTTKEPWPEHVERQYGELVGSIPFSRPGDWYHQEETVPAGDEQVDTTQGIVSKYGSDIAALLREGKDRLCESRPVRLIGSSGGFVMSIPLSGAMDWYHKQREKVPQITKLGEITHSTLSKYGSGIAAAMRKGKEILHDRKPVGRIRHF